MSTTSTRRIAIVEQEYLVAIDLEGMLEEHFGSETHILRPHEAAQRLNETAGDILFVDVDIDEATLIPILESKTAKLAKTVALTLGDLPFAVHGFDFVAQLPKPFTEEQVVEVMNRVLAHLE